jgi:hypothetical protein
MVAGLSRENLAAAGVDPPNPSKSAKSVRTLGLALFDLT